VQGYEKTIREGIARLKAAHLDVILMDPQYAPRILGRPIHKAIVDTIGEVSNDGRAEQTNAKFHRLPESSIKMSNQVFLM
jgi:hypothetical protein